MEMFDIRNSTPCDPIGNRRYSSSGLVGEKCATGHALVSNQAAHGKLVTGNENKLKIRNKINIATWNMTGLLQQGKLHILERELIREKILICGISETHWKDQGHFETQYNNIYISGANKTGRNGVAILVSKQISATVKSYVAVNDRIITLTINAKPMDIHIIQIYMPTTEAPDENIEEIYKQLENIVEKIPQKEQVIIMGDFNAKIGSTTTENNLREVVGPYGLGDRNDRGERLLQFASENGLAITNTMFKHHSRRLSTWISPNKLYKNQIDYVLVRQRWRTSITNVVARPGASCSTNHKLLKAHLKLKLHVTKTTTNTSKLNVSDPLTFQQILENANNNSLSNHPDTAWKTTKDIILKAASQGKSKTYKTNKHWMSTETFDLIEKRRMAQHKNDYNQVSRLDHQIKQSCRRDKNRHLNKVCDELEEHANKNESRELFDKVRYLAREFKPRTQMIEDEHGNIITDPVQISNVWKNYCQKLFRDDSGDIRETVDMPFLDTEPNILKSEVEAAIKKLKNGKSAGTDGITAEIIKAMGGNGITMFHHICNMIWKTGRWPSEWCKSVFIPIYKKGNPKDCSNYRTIALICHASKVMLHIIHERLKVFLLPQIAREQTGFVPGKGTREQILNVRQIIEKAREFAIPVYLCFVDYSKAFDTVKWQHLWELLKEMGTPIQLVQLIKALYEDSTALVRTNKVDSDEFHPEAGVRQGCIISPILFNIYSECIMRRVLDGWNGGVTIGGQKISNLRYADDTLILAASEDELRAIMQQLKRVSEEYGLKLNKSKTKVMVVDRTHERQPQPSQIAGYETMDEFNYLGSIVSRYGGCVTEIKRRLAIARSATTRLTSIWKNSAITQTTKLRLIKALIFPIATYASETWTIKQTELLRIDAFEMWVYRRMLRIPWTAHRTNISILEELKIKKRLSTTIEHSFLKYFGHICRRQDSMERLIVQGKVQGRRPRGRSPKRWIDQVKPLIGCGPHEASQMAQSRVTWAQKISKIP